MDLIKALKNAFSEDDSEDMKEEEGCTITISMKDKKKVMEMLDEAGVSYEED